MKTISALSIDCNMSHQQILMLINKWTIDKNYNTNLFTSKYDAIVPNQTFSVLPLYEAKYSKNTMIVWDMLSLQLCVDFPNINKIIYIQSDQIPWMTNPNNLYNIWSKVFDNPRVSVISMHKQIADIFRLTWNKGTFVESLDSEIIHEYL